MDKRPVLAALSLAVFLLSACSCGPGGDSVRGAPGDEALFDKTNAFAVLEHLCRIGYRAPGTPTAAKARDWLASELEKSGAKVRMLPFTAKDPPTGRTFECANIFASLSPENPKRVLLATHWDTRLWAERDPDPDMRDTPIMGANDGGSGVAVLVELCRLFSARTPGVGVDILLTDGEDLGKPGSKDYCQGAYDFVRKDGPFAGYKAEFAIVVDLVGDRDLRILRETYSLRHARGIVDRIWKSAKDLGYAKHFPDKGEVAILDDHVPLYDGLGIPSVLLIDWEYGPDHAWFHTQQDTLDKCSAESLEVVGRTVARVVYQEGRE